MARIDYYYYYYYYYYDDPQAPVANSVVPSANVVVVNDEGALLVIHRTDNDNWALPGGAMDPWTSVSPSSPRQFAKSGKRPESTAR